MTTPPPRKTNPTPKPKPAKKAGSVRGRVVGYTTGPMGESVALLAIDTHMKIGTTVLITPL